MININTSVTVAQVATVSQLMVKIYQKQKEALADTKLDGYFDFVDRTAGELIIAIKRMTISLSMDEADTRRDLTVRNFFTMLEGASVSLSEEEAGAAAKVLACAERYGRKMISEKLFEESAHIESLLKDLATSEMKAALAKIHMGPEYAEKLAKDEADFKAIQVEKNTVNVEQGNEKSATAIKKELREFINGTLIAYINAMCTIKGEEYKALADELDKEVRKANDSAKKQATGTVKIQLNE